MEKKLAEYRAKKEREAVINNYETKFKSFLNKYVTRDKKKNDETDTTPIPEPDNLIKTQEKQVPYFDINQDMETQSEGMLSDDEDDSETLNCCTYVDIIYYILWFIFWATTYAIFIKLQFGTVYFLVTSLIFIYFNTRTRPKKANEISAYSVFNKNCESIDGTLKAEQLERQMLYGLAGIR